MDVKGIVFAGTGTSARPQMSMFVREVLGLVPTQVTGVEADLFDLPTGRPSPSPPPEAWARRSAASASS